MLPVFLGYIYIVYIYIHICVRVSAYIPHMYVLSDTFEKSRSEIAVGKKPIGEKPLAGGRMGENSVNEKHISLWGKN